MTVNVQSSHSLSDAALGQVQKARRQWGKWGLIGAVVAYLSLILLIPALNIFVGAFGNGLRPFLQVLSDRNFLHAVKLTLSIVVIAVPFNGVFGLCAAWVIARYQFRGRTLLISIIDLPFSISPIVAGMMLVLLYGRNGIIGPLLQSLDIRVIFAFPGMVLATMLGGMPFVAREVIPVLEEIGTEQEEAAKTLGAGEWQIFWRVTLPSIRWALLYGVILTTARAMGEFGAIAVVSSNLIGRSQTLTLFVEEVYRQYQLQAALTASVVLASLAAFSLVIKELFERITHIDNKDHD
jgi:sulfate transport system permease protein